MKCQREAPEITNSDFLHAKLDNVSGEPVMSSRIMVPNAFLSDVVKGRGNGYCGRKEAFHRPTALE
jgi:hypothetical protein